VNQLLAVKGNQSQLLEQVKDEFRFSQQIEINKNEDIGYGRIETRVCSVITDFKFIMQVSGWNNLKSVIKIDSIREFKNSVKKTEKAT
jgi:hypothetical protein